MSFIVKGIDMPKETERVEVIFWRSIDKNDEYVIQHNMDVCAIEIPTPHGKLIDADKLSHQMYHQAFEMDSDLQKWESGCWIRYKMFENELEFVPVIIEREE